MRYLFFYGLLIIFFEACAPKITSSVTINQEPFPENEYVLILQREDYFENDGINVGGIRVGDNGFSINCSYNESVEKLKQLARSKGANVIKITEFKSGGNGHAQSTCDRIKGTLYRVPDARAHERKIEWTQNRKLRWQDFKGLPKNESESGYVAETASGISFQTNRVTALNKPKFFVKNTFDCALSWINPAQKDNDYVLGHEQLHFDLTEVYTRKLRKKLAESNITYATLYNATAYYNDIYSAYAERQKLYDTETNHGLNRIEQAKWRAKTDAELIELNAYSSIVVQ